MNVSTGVLLGVCDCYLSTLPYCQRFHSSSDRQEAQFSSWPMVGKFFYSGGSERTVKRSLSTKDKLGTRKLSSSRR